MKVFVCTDHAAFYPVGAASVVIAHDEAEARTLLDQALHERGLQSDTPYTLRNIELWKPQAIILLDGDY